MDWTNSAWGFLIGLLIFLLNIASLVAFFSITSTKENSDEYMSKVFNAIEFDCYSVQNKVVNGVTNCCGTIAVLLGLKASLHLVDKSKPEPALMDRLLHFFLTSASSYFSIGRFLLKVGVFFIMVFTCFAITVGAFPSNSSEKIGHDKIFRGENGNILEKENVGQDGGAIVTEEEEVVRVVENIPGELHVIAGILNLVQVSSKDLHHR